MENRHMVYESYYPGYSDSADTLVLLHLPSVALTYYKREAGRLWDSQGQPVFL